MCVCVCVRASARVLERERKGEWKRERERAFVWAVFSVGRGGGGKLWMHVCACTSLERAYRLRPSNQHIAPTGDDTDQERSQRTYTFASGNKETCTCKKRGRERWLSLNTVKSFKWYFCIYVRSSLKLASFCRLSESRHLTDVVPKGIPSRDATLGWQPQDLLPLNSLCSSRSVSKQENQSQIGAANLGETTLSTQI